MKTHRTHYHPLSISIHWITFFLLIAVYALIEFREIFPKGSVARDAMKTWHFMLGLTAFFLVFPRLLFLAIFPPPPIVPAPPAWQRFLAKAMHVALLAFLIVMPLLGWLALNAKGKPTPFFGMEMPALISPDKALGKSLESIHETIGIIGLYLIGLHTAAALFHHYILRDNALRRMLPGRRSKTAIG